MCQLGSVTAHKKNWHEFLDGTTLYLNYLCRLKKLSHLTQNMQTTHQVGLNLDLIKHLSHIKSALQKFCFNY